jgi:hypothetical protein
MLLSSFEWGYQKHLRSWGEDFSAWMADIPMKYWILVGIVIVAVLLVVLLPLFSSSKEEEVFTPPPIEPWPESVPVEPISDELIEAETEEDEFSRIERELDAEAMKKLKKEAEEQRTLLQIENKQIDLKNKEEMLKRKEKDIELKTRFGL